MTTRARSSFVLGLLMAFTGCREEPYREIRERYDNGREEIVRTYPERGDTSRYTLEEFYPSGKRRVVGHAQGDTIILTSWYENGQLEAEWSVVNELEHGDIRCWYPNGKLKKTNTLFLGEESGERREWYDDGRPKYEATFEDGRQTGRTHYWSKTGRYISRTYINDTLEGPTIEIDSIGGRMVGQYRNALEEGQWIWMDSTNRILSSRIYRKGRVVSEPIR